MARSLDAILAVTTSAVTESLDAVPGFTLVYAEHMRLTFNDDPSHLAVVLDGWSPSLHQITMRHSFPIPWHVAPSELRAEIRNGLSGLLRAQAARAARGAALGHALPIHLAPRAPSRVGPFAIDHLHADRTLLRLALREGSNATTLRIRNYVRAAHTSVQQVRREDDPLTLARGFEDICSIDDRSGTSVISFQEDLADGVRMFGSRLVLADQLIPKTLCAALAGRPLGSALTIDAAPELSERTIARVWHDRDPARHLVIDLVPDTVSLGEIVAVETN